MGPFLDSSKGNCPCPGRRPNPIFPRSPLGKLLATAGVGIARKRAQGLGSAGMRWEEGRTALSGRDGGEN